VKLVHEEILFGGNELAIRPELAACLDDVRKAIKCVVWPEGSRRFSINPTVDGNGVLPIKVGFLQRLRGLNWQLEQRPVLARGLGPGKIDALKSLGRKLQFAAEWETGNISSSHRALNKICVGILEGHLAGGALILPDRELYNYLTQRIGNFRELAPYFPVYRNLRVPKGILAVFSVSYDRVSKSVALIAKGMDGHSFKRRAMKA
jgi:hypothetical protein